MMQLYHILGEPFGYLMRFIYNLVQNYGVAIVLFTLVTRIILFPVGYKQMKNSARMSLINEKLAKIRKAYSGNQQKIQEEQMKLYQEEHVNPMGSCLPMFLQFIILFGVLDVVYRPLHHILRINNSVITSAAKVLVKAKFPSFKSAGQLRDELFILSAAGNSDYKEKFLPLLQDIDGLDITKLQHFYNNFQLFGIHLGKQPTIHPDVWNAEAVGLFLIPIFAGVFQLLLTIIGQVNMRKNNPEAQNQQMRGMNVMMYIMPVFSVWFAFAVPAGVGFYWICSSVFSLFQTIGLNAYFTPERSKKIALKEKEKAEKKAASGKVSMYQKLMDAQSQQQAGLSKHMSEVEKQTNGMSRKEKERFNNEKVAKARMKMAEKYGDELDKMGADNDTEDESDKLKLARRRMALKYGDKIED